jgi:hypothetical protein
VKGQGVVAEIARGRLAPKEPIVLPPNVSLLSGVHVGLSDKDENTIELGWKRAACREGV